MRKALRSFALSTLGSLLTPSTGIHILNGHYISRETKDASIFYDLLKMLQKKVNYIRIEEAMELVEKRKSPNHSLVAFTFDDGYEECYTKIAPVLSSFETNAAFFINTNFIECNESYKLHFLNERVLVQNKNPMTWAMVKSLNDEGFIIGAHTLDHVRLNTSDRSILLPQIEKCKIVIENKLDRKCDYFAYPYGQKDDLSAEALDIASKNYKHIFTGFNHKKYYSFEDKAINRRHFEGDWNILHMNYFLSTKKSY